MRKNKGGNIKGEIRKEEPVTTYRITESFSGEYLASNPAKAWMKFRKEHSFLKEGLLGPQDQTFSTSIGDEEKARKEHEDIRRDGLYGAGAFALLFLSLRAPYLALAVLVLSYIVVEMKKSEKGVTTPGKVWVDHDVIYICFWLAFFMFTGAFMGSLLIGGNELLPTSALKGMLLLSFSIFWVSLLGVKRRF